MASCLFEIQWIQLKFVLVNQCRAKTAGCFLSFVAMGDTHTFCSWPWSGFIFLFLSGMHDGKSGSNNFAMYVFKQNNTRQESLPVVRWVQISTSCLSLPAIAAKQLGNPGIHDIPRHGTGNTGEQKEDQKLKTRYMVGIGRHNNYGHIQQQSTLREPTSLC